MFSCVVHNWNSHSAPCPMCFPATYTSDSGTDDDIVIINRAVYPCPSCAALQSSLKEKENKIAELEKVLTGLVNLKELKDTEGKTEIYLQLQPIAWKQAKELLKP